MPLRYLGKAKGFSVRYSSRTGQTPYLPYEKSKFWRSPVSAQAVLDDVLKYGNDTPKPNDPMLGLAIDYTRRRFACTPQKMLHLNEVFQQDLDIWQSSPGLPWKEYGFKVKDDIRKSPDAIAHVRTFWKLVKDGKKIEFPDCMALMRSHVCERGQQKVRAVWGYPATVTFGEAVFALPLIKYYKSMGDLSPIAYGYETAVGGARRICERFARHKHYTALDFKNFDKTVPAWLVRAAFAILRCNIDFVRYIGGGTADARKTWLMWKRIEDYFINTKIRMNDGRRYSKSGGVASGSYFTQLIDSVVNCILISWFSLRQHGTFPDDSIYMGDDSFIGSACQWDLDKCAEYAEEIGMQVNVKKSATSRFLRNITFLGYSLGDGVPFKDHSAWMAALLFPERQDLSFSDVQNRALGLLYANMGVDSEFHNLCRRIVQARKFDLAISRNLQRVFRYVGVPLAALDPSGVPPVDYFFKYFF